VKLWKIAPAFQCAAGRQRQNVVAKNAVFIEVTEAPAAVTIATNKETIRFMRYLSIQRIFNSMSSI